TSDRIAVAGFAGIDDAVSAANTVRVIEIVGVGHPALGRILSVTDEGRYGGVSAPIFVRVFEIPRGTFARRNSAHRRKLRCIAVPFHATDPPWRRACGYISVEVAGVCEPCFVHAIGLCFGG